MSILFLLLVPLLVLSQTASSHESLPHWMKNNAKLWHDGIVSDDEFVNTLKYLVENKVIPIKFVIYDKIQTTIPPSLKDIAYYWSIGKVSDKDFVSTIRVLIKSGAIELSPKFESQMHQELRALVGNDTAKSIVVVPVLTASAYGDHGFYWYYRGECDKKCLTVKIRDDIPSFMSSKNAVAVLKSLGYSTITDVDIDKNPRLLEKYDKIIVLHNEYVTQREFTAITNHHHVLYLYPNSLYAKVKINYSNDTVTLVRGHGYPDKNIRNGFDWKYDNSHHEYDTDCTNWHFTSIKNGIMLNCYPEARIDYDIFLLGTIAGF
jgi:hypothetical protein